MDAPTTRSADNGTSGGGSGWFTPQKQPEPAAGGDQGVTDGRRLAGLRPVGRNAADPHGGNEPQDRTTDAGSRIQPSPPPFVEVPAQTQNPVQAQDPVQAQAPTQAQAPIAAQAAAAPPPAPAAPEGLAGSRLPTQQITALAEPRPPEWRQPTVPPAEPLVPAQRSAQVQAASPDAVLVRRTMAEVGPVADKVTSYFYAMLFVRHPELRSLFPPAMDAQRDRLLKALLTAAEHIDNTPVLVEYLQNLGRGHRKYGTQAEHYPAVGECLIGALSRYADAVWDAETEAAWVRTYTTISQVMIDAAAVDELRAPAWWHAEVVSHDLRTPNVAILTVRPNQPYPFRAGQYASVETPWWPRIWRHFSFASAPRSDGLLTFHVKAIPAGWVSNSLVHRARPGDVIRLGPPAGSMTVDHTRNSGLLCLGGGTGIAPIKALVEDVAEHGARRPVEVFYGARSDHDLYDIDTMLRLQQSHPWLQVRPVVDRHGLLQLPDAIRTFGPWTAYDAYVSGPPGMIRSSVDALRGVGIPSERIRHDSVEELAAAGS